jgi:hypothetical protein
MNNWIPLVQAAGNVLQLVTAGTALVTAILTRSRPRPSEPPRSDEQEPPYRSSGALLDSSRRSPVQACPSTASGDTARHLVLKAVPQRARNVRD